MKAVIFDFNGTMVFDSYYHDMAWKKFSKEIRGYELSDEELAYNIHGKVNEKIIEYLKPNVDAKMNKHLSLEKEAMYRKLCKEDKKNYKFVKGLEPLMNELKLNKIPFTICSASIKENIDFFVETFQLEHWIDPKLIVYDDGSYENKVEMFKESARRMNVKISDCLVFEDSFSGIENAKEAGVNKIIAITSDQYVEEYKKNNAITMVITDYEDARIKGVMND